MNSSIKKLTLEEMKLCIEKEAQVNFKLLAGYVEKDIKSEPAEPDEGHETTLYERILSLIPSIDECKAIIRHNVKWFWDGTSEEIRSNLFTNEVRRLIQLKFENDENDYIKIYEKMLFNLTTDELYNRFLEESKCKQPN